ITVAHTHVVTARCDAPVAKVGKSLVADLPGAVTDTVTIVGQVMAAAVVVLPKPGHDGLLMLVARNRYSRAGEECNESNGSEAVYQLWRAAKARRTTAFVSSKKSW